MKRVIVIPKEGLKVRDPETKQHLPKDGKAVSKNHYWIRRSESGDVNMVDMKEKKESPEFSGSKNKKQK